MHFAFLHIKLKYVYVYTFMFISNLGEPSKKLTFLVDMNVKGRGGGLNR